MGTRSISLFSCRDFRGKWAPQSPQAVVLQKWVGCHTCFVEICPYDNRCIKLIEPEGVNLKLDRLLGEA